MDGTKVHPLQRIIAMATDTPNADPAAGKLVIPSEDTAATVLVVAMFPGNQSAISVAGFGLSKLGPFYQGGVAWAYPGKSPGLTITWVLGDGVSYLSSNSPSIQFSPAFDGQQLLTVPAETDTYDFTVHFTKGGSEDPQIIVTPT